MTTKHTPGPWGCKDTSNHSHDYRLSKKDGSTLPVHAPHNDHAEQRANAKLIAAAPDLLAALQELVGCENDMTINAYKYRERAFAAARVVIAQATST